MIEWFIGQNNGAVNGYSKAVYTGLPTIALAEIVGDVIRNHQKLTGLYHVSSDPITKYELLCLVRDKLQLSIEINELPVPVIDASLNSEKFRIKTGYTPLPWERLVETMASDDTPYTDWHNR